MRVHAKAMNIMREQMLTEVVAGRPKLWTVDRSESVLATLLLVLCNK